MTNKLQAGYAGKKLQIAYSLDDEDRRRLVIVNPETVRLDVNRLSGLMYDDFLNRGNYESIEIDTNEQPGVLALRLEDKFGVDAIRWIGGMIAELNATLPQAKKVLDYMKLSSGRK